MARTGLSSTPISKLLGDEAGPQQRHLKKLHLRVRNDAVGGDVDVDETDFPNGEADWCDCARGRNPASMEARVDLTDERHAVHLLALPCWFTVSSGSNTSISICKCGKGVNISGACEKLVVERYHNF
jgi:hypothetical protein